MSCWSRKYFVSLFDFHPDRSINPPFETETVRAGRLSTDWIFRFENIADGLLNCLDRTITGHDTYDTHQLNWPID